MCIRDRKNRVRNTQIREDLEVISILDFIEQRQLCWWGHMKRMYSDRMVKQVWEAKSGGRKKRGRPQLTWDGIIGNILRERGLGWREAKRCV